MPSVKIPTANGFTSDVALVTTFAKLGFTQEKARAAAVQTKSTIGYKNSAVVYVRFAEELLFSYQFVMCSKEGLMVMYRVP